METARRASLIMAACRLAAGAGPLTGYAGFVASYAVTCVSGTRAGDASCDASTGALAAVWGVLGVVATLPFAVRLRRRVAASGDG